VTIDLETDVSIVTLLSPLQSKLLRNRDGKNKVFNEKLGFRFLYPRPHMAEALSDETLLTSVCLTSAAFIWPKSRTGRLKLAQRLPTSHAIRTPFSKSKGQRSTCRGGGILWRLLAQLVRFNLQMPDTK